MDTATGGGEGISCGSMAVSGGSLKVEGQSSGIRAYGELAISSGTVSSTATGEEGVGVSIESGDARKVTVGEDTVSFIASGAKGAFSEGVTVMNVVAGTGWTDAEGKTGKAPIAVAKLSVTLTSGANATASGGATEQAVEEGSSMAAVTYAAKAGYHFEAFEAISANGVTAELEGGKVVVSGTPTADVKIKVPDAVRDAESAPARVAKPSTSGHPGAGTLDASWKPAKGAESYEVQWRKAGGKWKTKATKGLKYTIRTRTRCLLGILLGVVVALGLLPGTGATAFATGNSFNFSDLSENQILESDSDIAITNTGDVLCAVISDTAPATYDGNDGVSSGNTFTLPVGEYEVIKAHQYAFWCYTFSGGFVAGTQDMGRRGEAIQVVIVAKGAPAPGITRRKPPNLRMVRRTARRSGCLR